ncbi:serine aminopeptidase domain-containing protein, partial [Candidatus Phytoplasma phoenicium]|uniref:serine aminopeptidase domain-containing protein n=1 Tax=Candidatus Phytoplasma phoenicium TaxID=198422 RepID=UPI000ABEFA28
KRKLNFQSSKISHISLTQNYHPYRLDYVTPRFLRNLLFLSLLFLQKKFQFYRTPVLCLYSVKDQIVSYQHGIFLRDHVFSSVKNLKLYQETYHNLFHDIEKERVLQDIYQWLEQQK